ncbi:MAG: hypothetical protein ACDS79_16230, partial [Enterobacteriaceae bacterium]
RHRQHHAAQDHLVRAEAPLRPRDPHILNVIPGLAGDFLAKRVISLNSPSGFTCRWYTLKL